MIDSYRDATIAILTTAVLFLLFLLVKRILFRLRMTRKGGSFAVSTYLAEKVSGLILFGIIPYFIFIKILSMTYHGVGLSAGNSLKYWYLLGVTMAIVSFLTYLASGREQTWERFPQLRLKVWTVKHSLLSLAGWLLYIAGYEFLFRGVLWSVCYANLGLYPALLINVTLYALAHLDQGPSMILGSIPAGIVLCLFAMITGSFVFPFLIHFWMAANNELFCIFRNPDLRFDHISRRSPT